MLSASKQCHSSSTSGPFGERETHAAKNLDRAIEHLRERVERADFVRRAGQRNIELGERAGFLRGAQLFARLLERGGDGAADLVEQLADDGPLFFRERLHLLAPGGDAPALARGNGRARRRAPVR